MSVGCNKVVDGRNDTYYSINMIGWGIAHDANVTAEGLRCCGALRYDIAGLSYILKGYNREIEIEVKKEGGDTVSGKGTLTLTLTLTLIGR